MIGQVRYLGPTDDITEVRYLSNSNMNESAPAGKKTVRNTVRKKDEQCRAAIEKGGGGVEHG
jgi:hypothetical protein